MSKSLTLAAHSSSHTTAMYASYNVKIDLQIIYRIVPSIHSSAGQGLSETALTRIRAKKYEARDYDDSKNMSEPNKCSALRSVGNQLALAVTKRGLWTLVGMIMLKVMTLCEGIAGTVDFAQMLMQSLDFWKGF